MKKTFYISDYKIGDSVRCFGKSTNFIVVYINELKKYVVFNNEGECYCLEDAHYYRIRSIQREQQIIAKRKKRNKTLLNCI
ncbi:MAG: hypothetical protein ACRCZK_03580 [Oscillospiraceae bacterium]